MIDHDNYYYSGVDARFQIINHNNYYYSGIEIKYKILRIINPNVLSLLLLKDL